MAWQTPKTNWSSADGVRDTDLNRIEENTRVLYFEKLRDNTTIYVSPSGNNSTGNGSSMPTTTRHTCRWVILKL